MVSREKDKGNIADRQHNSKIARAVFSAAEATGIVDRELLEQLAEQVIERLERLQPLPGMEDLVSDEIKSRKVSEAEIQAKVREVLSETTKVRKKKISPAKPTPDKSAPDQAGPAPAEVAAQVQVRPSESRSGGIEISSNAVVVLERRYLRKNKDGQVIESPEQLFRRVAHHIASAEAIYDRKADIGSWGEKFYQVMAAMEFLPNSPTLMNAGRELGQLSACFVLPIEDSMESIFDAVKNTALIHKSGGGTGFSFSRLRPEQDRVGSTGGVASGPVSFMRAFDAATDVIKQGGMRRGANMAILKIDHPDVMRFITCKENHDVLTNFNISVAVTESFMRAVEQGTDYDLINPRTNEVSGRMNAREVFDKMVDMAWRNGDPGLVFLDRINRDNPTPHLGSIESTNPCGEQPLLPYESCNLGSINLSRMIGEEDGAPAIDWDKLARVVKTAVRFLDNVIDMNKFPLSEIEETTKSTRKIGLGVMAFADMLMRLRIPYDSKEALKTGKSVMEFVEKEATAASVELATERGVFPAFEGSIYDKRKAPRVRNATRTTIAPTGTLSIIANCSSGIEPLFALSYSRNILDGDRLVEVNPLFEEIARNEGIFSDQLMNTLAEQGRVRGVEGIPEWVQQVFVTAHDISPEWHVRMQAAFQRHTNNAVSKTINFPHEATRGDVAKAYMLAYKEGCKGITIYRDRSREVQVLDIGKEKLPEEKGMVPRERPDATFGVTEKMTTGCGNLYITVNFDDRGICEVFTSLGKSGGCASAQLEAISRLISMSLRAGLSAESLVKHIKGIRCPAIAWDRGHAVLSCADAIGTVLERQLNNGPPQIGVSVPDAAVSNNGRIPVNSASSMGGQCPDCSGLLVYQEGCHICYGCGYTKCS